MRSAWITAAVAALSVGACGGGGGGGGGGGSGTGFAGYDPLHDVIANPGGPADNQMGSAVAFMDWNEDGLTDAFVGSPGQATDLVPGSGAVFLYTQAPAGTWTLTRTWDATDWAGGVASQLAAFGDVLVAADLNGDGRLDLAIGAPGDPVGLASDAGRVYVLFDTADHLGTTAGPFADPAGAEAGAEFGAAMASGFVNADALEDLVVATPDATIATITSAGRVTVFAGASAGTFGATVLGSFTEAAPEDAARLGAALAVGDVDADGYDDVVAGVPGASGIPGGEVQVWSRGTNPGFSLLRTVTTAEGGIQAEFGAAVALADLDEDGDLDLVVGAPFGDVGPIIEAGYAIVFTNLTPATATFSAGTLVQDRTTEGGSQFGAVLAVGFVDADEDMDLVVAAPAATEGGAPGAGHFTLYVGGAGAGFLPPTAADVYGSVTPTDDQAFAAALDLADVNGDGFDDVVAGVPGPLDFQTPQPGQTEILNSTSN